MDGLTVYIYDLASLPLNQTIWMFDWGFKDAVWWVAGEWP